ncbi:hypothetical protein ESY86_18175 [Subsaximicrobium wynnwilliamsii]|uniref:Porin family protein n=1 Tax=Subsaximicrobium wynnwilliamsii TaxID=291179 RepID=A0A5C6ZE14_9FLAO|nr:hypothetical protein [Subsaximicrobium wynnwilliamsii]TXD81462.1 hypothetical protein ESY87_18120 [Subsaximicrobium wynnwilliamsii]TXD87060.1 hypothetical protein ESY86_18175 [Subsaximicrobium wynnwilliamsii]TXE00817.1 hypothetical protein ESY88_18370 [Subsaximicrobium wynnwilliamsii]
MSSTLPIKRLAFVLACLCGSFVFSQDLTETTIPEPQDAPQAQSARERKVALSFDLYRPSPSGNNFFAESASGSLGFNFDLQLFVYKQFFLGGGIGDSYFDNKDISKTGNYEKTTLSSHDFYVGYEFLPLEDFRLGVAVTIVGNSRYKNNQSNTRKVYQVDHGNLRNYQTYFAYEVDRTLSVFIKYTYRSDRTKIQVPSALNSYFEKTAVHQIGFGLKLYFGEKSVF